MQPVQRRGEPVAKHEPVREPSEGITAGQGLGAVPRPRNVFGHYGITAVRELAATDQKLAAFDRNGNGRAIGDAPQNRLCLFRLVVRPGASLKDVAERGRLGRKDRAERKAR